MSNKFVNLPPILIEVCVIIFLYHRYCVIVNRYYSVKLDLLYIFPLFSILINHAYEILCVASRTVPNMCYGKSVCVIQRDVQNN